MSWRNRAEPVKASWRERAEPIKDSQEIGGEGQTALESYGNAASMGYLPQLQAMSAPVVDRATNLYLKATGQPEVEAAPFSQIKPGTPEYLQARDENVRRLQAQEQANPKSALAGGLVGSIAGTAATPIPGFGVGGGLLKSAAKLGAAGALQGAVMNPGDVEGEFAPLQVQDRLDNAETGAALGLVGAGIGQGAKKLAESGAKASSKLKDYADVKSFKAAGGMLKDFRRAYGKGRIGELGEFANKEGLVKAGDTFEDVARKSGEVQKQAGQELGLIYDKARSSIEGMSPEIKARIQSKGFNPVAQKQEIISSIKEGIKGEKGSKNAVAQIENYLDEIAVDYGSDLDPKTANVIKGKIDKAINYDKEIKDSPAVQQAFFKLRTIVRDKVNQQVDEIGKEVGGDLGKQLKAANKRFGNSIELSTMADDKIARENANRMFGLTDTIAGVGGMGAGAAIGGSQGGDIESALKGAGVGLLAGGANNLARRYGPALQSATARTAAGIAERTVDPVSKGLLKVPITQQTASRALVNEYLRKRK